LVTPTLGTFTASDATHLVLNWTNGNSTATTEIWRRTGAAASALLATASAAATTYTDTTVVAATNYVYKLRHLKAGVYSPFTVDKNGHTTPAAPTSLGAVVTGTTAALSWTNPDPTLTTNIYRTGTSNATYSVGAGVSTYNDTSLADGTYTYKVRAFDGSLESADSNSASGTVDTTVSPPTMTSAIATGSTIAVTWVCFNGTLQTRVYRGGTLIATKSATVTTHSDTGLANGTYSYTVRHWNGTAESVNSSSASDTVAVASITAPSGLTGSNTQYADRISLSWTNGNAAKHTEIYRALGAGAMGLIATANPGDTSYIDDGLTPNTAYHYKIRHYDTPDFSNYTTILDKSTQNTSLTSVAVVASVGSNKFTLTFTYFGVRFGDVFMDTATDNTGLNSGYSVASGIASPYAFDPINFTIASGPTSGGQLTISQVLLRDSLGATLQTVSSVISSTFKYDSGVP